MDPICSQSSSIIIYKDPLNTSGLVFVNYFILVKGKCDFYVSQLKTIYILLTV